MSLLDYNSQLLFQKHLFLFVFMYFIRTHVCAHTHARVYTKAWLWFFKRFAVPQRFSLLLVHQLQRLQEERSVIYGLD